MTIKQMHQTLYEINNTLDKQFATQLAAIYPGASLCYQGHNKKFTLSLYAPYVPELSKVETEHVILLSSFPLTEDIEKLANSISKYIINN